MKKEQVPTLILASQSPRRRELLEEGGFTFKVVVSSVKEILDNNLTPRDNALKLAKEKALSVATFVVATKVATTKVAPTKVHAVILAADTIVVLNNEIIGKPKDEEDAITILTKLSKKIHEVITAFTVYDTKTKKGISKAVSTHVKFKKISGEQIKDYVQKFKPFDKAGAYAIQESEGTFIEKIEGSFTNVMGLPLHEVTEILSEYGVYPKK